MTQRFIIRLAVESDIPALANLIPESVRALQTPYYSAAQIEGALGSVFDVDRRLIGDGTYFVAEKNKTIVGCGGWSRRRAVCGGDRGRTCEEAILDPSCDAARIRAFFVHPDHARQGIGRAILSASETALCAAGFREAVLVATLAGEPLYASFGYSVVERYEDSLPNGLVLPVVRMMKNFRR